MESPEPHGDPVLREIPDADHPATDRLQRPHFGMHRFGWSANLSGAVEFHVPHGEMLRLLRRSGFEVEDLVEIGAPGSAGTEPRPADRLATGRVVSPLAERRLARLTTPWERGRV